MAQNFKSSANVSTPARQQLDKWLPTVLLGLRTAYKEDIKCYTAEVLYGTSLRVPGEFFEDADHSPMPEVFLQDLRDRMRKVRAKPTTHHGRCRAAAAATSLFGALRDLGASQRQTVYTPSQWQVVQHIHRKAKASISTTWRRRGRRSTRRDTIHIGVEFISNAQAAKQASDIPGKLGGSTLASQ